MDYQARPQEERISLGVPLVRRLPVFRVKRMRGLRLTGGTSNRNSTKAQSALAA
jgi:hypothetical protein